MMGHDISSPNMGKMMRQNKYQIVPSWDETMMGHNMHKAKTGNNMDKTQMGHNMDNTIMGAPMVQAMLGHNMDSNMMGRDMATNLVDQDMPSHMMDRSMMGSQDMYTNANLMGRDMNRMAPLNMMSHKMQIETMPSQSFTRFF